MRTHVVALLLLSAGFVGCLGETGGVEDRQETTNCDEGEVDQGKNGRVSPAESMTLQANVTGEPATGEISIDAQGTGGFTVVLERDGEEAWSESFDGTGNQGGNYHPNPLSAGNYTLTASSETGVYEIDLSLHVSWSEGCA